MVRPDFRPPSSANPLQNTQPTLRLVRSTSRLLSLTITGPYTPSPTKGFSPYSLLDRTRRPIMFKPKTLLYAAGALGGGYVVLNSMSDFKTPGIRNIEARHSSAGGADSHTPAGGTKMGDKDAVGTDSKGTNSNRLISSNTRWFAKFAKTMTSRQ